MSRTPNTITRRHQYQHRAAAALRIEGHERMPSDELANAIKATDPLVATTLQKFLEREAYLAHVGQDQHTGFVELLRARDAALEAQRAFLATVTDQ